MICVDVAINLPVKSIFRQFTYAVPEELPFLDVGWRVVVPFHGQTVEGFIVRRVPAPTEPQHVAKIKYVTAALGREPWFDAEMLQTAYWLSQYYMCSQAEAMRLFIPGRSSIKRKAVRNAQGKLLYYEYDERLKEKTVLAYAITEAGREALAANTLAKRAKAQHAALITLAQQSEPLSVSELAAYKVSAATLRTLAAQSYALTSQKRVLRNSYARKASEAEAFQLTDEQAAAVVTINAAQTAKREHGETFLLHGITGSGKTEVYLRITDEALAQGKQVLMLVPEIALTAQLVKRFQAWFGDNIAVAHSKLSQNERADVWHRMRTGGAQILIGVRSAVFAPFKDLGLVIIDEEHESSYKQEERPSYSAKVIARMRCYQKGAPLVLGSATPDLESYYKAKQGEYHYLHLTKRPLGNALPDVQIVDMRAELQAKNFSVLSRPLRAQLEAVTSAGKQAIVLLNRRGYSTFVMCRDCGHTLVCPHCAVSLVYHSAQEDMRCHYCGNTVPVPMECPECHSKRIKFFGSGTQKAEAELAEIPGVRVLRMDQDSTATKFAHEEILHSFASGEKNVLIGTQMVAKGHDIPNVTLVGMLSADSALNLPDFRAAERAFSLLTQAAGRAGRGREPGHVYLQTYDKENHILALAAKQDYDGFAKQELELRQAFGYPPFTQMLKMVIWSESEADGLALGKKVVLYLQNLLLEKKLSEDVLMQGPFPALVGKVRDKYRYNIIIKAANLRPVKKALWESEFREQKNLIFDVDPMSVV